MNINSLYIFNIPKVFVLAPQSYLTLCNPVDCSPLSSIHGILQTRMLEWVAIPFSRGSSRPKDWTQVSCTVGRFCTVWATREAPSLHIKRGQNWSNKTKTWWATSATKTVTRSPHTQNVSKAKRLVAAGQCEINKCAEGCWGKSAGPLSAGPENHKTQFRGIPKSSS